MKTIDERGEIAWDMRPFGNEKGVASAAAGCAAAADSLADAESTGDAHQDRSESDGKVPWIPIDPSQPDLEQVCLLWQ